MFWKYKHERDELQKQNSELGKKILDLEIELSNRNEKIKTLHAVIENQKPRPYFPVYTSTEDPSPVDAQERAAYVSNVVTFFENIGLNKLGQLVAKAKEDLSNPLNERDYDLVIKGTINAFAQLEDWYDEAYAEMNQPKQDKVNQNTN